MFSLDSVALVMVLGQCPHAVRNFLRVLASGVIPSGGCQSVHGEEKDTGFEVFFGFVCQFSFKVSEPDQAGSLGDSVSLVCVW